MKNAIFYVYYKVEMHVGPPLSFLLTPFLAPSLRRTALLLSCYFKLLFVHRRPCQLCVCAVDCKRESVKQKLWLRSIALIQLERER